jgi:hypothetical protein
MREFAVAHVVSVRAAGGSLHRAAQELGLSEVTLSSWVGASCGPGRLRKVVVAPEPAKLSTAASEASLVLAAPSGHIVSGLSVPQAAALLRALS